MCTKVAIHTFLLVFTTGVESLSFSRRQALQTSAAFWGTATSADASTIIQESSQSWASSPTDDDDDDDDDTALLSNGQRIPFVGYSMYKTAVEQVAPGVTLALAAGTRHFDCATQYGTNAQVGEVLQEYIRNGGKNLFFKGKNSSRQRAFQMSENDVIVPLDPIPRTPAQRRSHLFVTHKVSNAEQNLDASDLSKSILAQRDVLLGTKGGGPLDLVMIHSPLTDKERRLRTYATLIDLQQRGQVQSVGVCHYSVAHLQEIIDASLPPPQVIQLELSPFHLHQDISAWATQHQSILSCAAWSKLSSTQGPIQGWTQLAKLAAARGGTVTKQQILIAWAIQKGFLCVPRSGSKYKVEKAAIVENTWRKTRDISLTAEEMACLDALDEQLPVGQLGVVDGWKESDIVNEKWDPTLLTV